MGKPRRKFLRALVGIESLEPRQLLSSVTPIYSFPEPYYDPNSLITDGHGNFYGTICGGSNGYGAVFELVKNTTTPVILANFTGTNGITDADDPPDAIVLGSDGTLYGTTTIGGIGFTLGNGGQGIGEPGDGVVWKLPSGSSTITDVAQFDTNGFDGYSPESGLAIDSNNNLFGTTEAGGMEGLGTVWEIPANSNSINYLASFGDNVSLNQISDVPTGAIALDSNDDVFGTAQGGAAESIPDANGAIWEVAAGSGSISNLPTNLAFFNEGSNNSGSPTSGLVRDSFGNLFGIELGVDSNADGGVFEYPSGSSSATVPAPIPFDFTNGSFDDYEYNGNIIGPFTFDSQGNLYGVSYLGGPGDNPGGTIFEIPKNGDSIDVLASVAENGPDGSNPDNLVYDPVSGKFFGIMSTNPTGAANNTGTIFTFTPGTVTVGAASQLAIEQAPSDGTCGVLSQSTVVDVEDSDGNIVTTNDSKVTLSLVTDVKGAKLAGTVTETAVNGVATFSNLSIADEGSFALKATDAKLTPATSASFALSPNLVWATEPKSTVSAGIKFSPSLVVEFQTSGGQPVPNATGGVTVSAGPGNLLGTTTENAKSGKATFANLSIQTPGTYTLTATSGTFGSVNSTQFIVNPGNAAKLVFIQQPPTSVGSGDEIEPFVQVAVEDAYGNLLSTDNETLVTLGYQISAPHAAKLNVIFEDEGGIATFAGIAINTSGTYEFKASARGVKGTTSDKFVVT
jgi:hypothetical protein